MDTHPESASQTAGPYVHIGCTPNFAGITGVYDVDLGATMITGDASGKRITLIGQVFDGTGTPLRDAMVEAWQADANGLYAGQEGADPHFTGFGRCPCDAEDGTFRFETLRPASVPWPSGGVQAPHITLWIVARGINIGLHTRAYFADAPENESDPVLGRIEHRNRVATLLAHPESDDIYRFNVTLQGPDETIFFDV
ncbi:protocatechuate 3,4-dioxygenase subunit alpha [Sulfitobacter sp. F26204]|uniref:protocatechuate 3,4-dioxygenase subunit alpha n=1 Tax=Sulfitobacter sp. F26204 TaxID=2996014 RepID=UPI00225E4ED2|nr:protocatechuate 3,4-dioxygenase subunit alpha [Sulfitobacter sp. F26204]MCX7560130.1 protocatechuate 3,4-dioxygenase subunit alpha [Sulfitobacter sp. F26204]